MIFRNFKFAWDSMKENRVRTKLSILGIVISIITINLIMSITGVLGKYVENEYNKIGIDLMWVTPSANKEMSN